MKQLTSLLSSIASVLAAAGIGLGASTASAQTADPLKPQLVSATQVIEELTHLIRIYKYEPPLPLAPAPTGVVANSPEGVVSAWIAAMREGDYDRTVSFWDDASKVMIDERNRTLGKTAEQWAAQWRSMFAAVKAQAKSQVLFDSVTLIQYQLIDPSGQQVGGESVVLKQVGGQWKLTLTYADHAVLQGWDTPRKRVTRIAPKR